MKTEAQIIFMRAGIEQKEIAEASGRSKAMVSKVMSGRDKSRFIMAAAYDLLQERLGQQCPPFDEVFNVR